jgi:prevent-host-death family protein
MHEAKTQFSKLIERTAGGEEIVITKSGKPVAWLIPYTSNRELRRPGYLRGRLVEDGVVKSINVEAPGKFEVSDTGTMLKALG